MRAVAAAYATDIQDIANLLRRHRREERPAVERNPKDVMLEVEPVLLGFIVGQMVVTRSRGMISSTMLEPVVCHGFREASAVASNGM